MSTPAEDSKSRDFVAIVIPCYRSAETVGILADRLVAVLSQRDCVFQLIFVDDASPDGTWSALEAIKVKLHERALCIRLARNVGQHAAIICGMAAIATAATQVVTMDDDLQHRPEDVPLLLDALQTHDIAIAAFDERKNERWKNIGGRLVDGTLRRLFGLQRSFQLTSFRAFRRFVCDEVTQQPAMYIYITSSILAASNSVVNVPVQWQSRVVGVSGYNYVKSISLALNLIFNYSRVPYIFIILIWAVSFLFTLYVTLSVIILRILTDEVIPGWSSVMVMIGLQGTLMMSISAVLLIYVARSHRILSQTKARYRVADRL